MAKLTEEQRQGILADYRAGMKLEAIAAKYGCNYTYAPTLAKRRGIERREPQHRNPLLAVVYRKIADSHARGLPAKWIANYWGIGERHVYKIVREVTGA